MGRKTISQRVLELLKKEDKPIMPEIIAQRLGLKVRDPFIGSYNWGKWSFLKAEKEGLIKWIDKEGWVLVKNERNLR